MADIRFNVTDAAGVPIPNASVAVAMQKHAFGFGSALQSRRLESNNAANATYKQKVEELFNYATIENSTKWPPWASEWGGLYDQATTLAALSWLNSKDIGVRGHTYLMECQP